MHYFNIGGVCDPRIHYMVPAAERLPEVADLVAREAYFVVHAPRQTGKTTSLRALMREITAQGRYAALHFSCEVGQATGDDYGATEDAILALIQDKAGMDLPLDCRPSQDWPPPAPRGGRLTRSLMSWAQACPRPLVLVFDEIDALWGRGLESVLRQLRAGHPERPSSFPSSIILCGMRSVRDYKKASGGGEERLGSASSFNILIKSLRLGDFTEDHVRGLLMQHTAETGRVFTEDALCRVMELTAGQPWLVNAVAREIVDEMRPLLSAPVTPDVVDEAKERLILARATHLDSLSARLMEGRVRRVLEPVLAGGLADSDTYDDDFQYVRDLGLVADGQPARIANPIYREIIARVLTLPAAGSISAEPRSFVQSDGTLNLRRVLEEFAEFWRENGDILAGRMPWHEVAAQLILMAWLQRVVNGGGHVDREFGINRGRIDLLVRWPYRDPGGGRQMQREALELKVWAPGRSDPLATGLKQIDAFLSGLGLDQGVLVIFDKRPEARPIEERTRFDEVVSPLGRVITVLRG